MNSFQLDSLQLKMCDIQGRLFELSGKENIPSGLFIKTFMNSEVAKGLDSTYNKLQWMGEEYLLEEVKDALQPKEAGRPSGVIESTAHYGDVLSLDVLYWIGYIYRYWHYYTGEDSPKILKQAPVPTMKRNYMMFHTMDPIIAIEDLKEIYYQKSQKANI